jgi:3-dehydroquinate synthase
MLVRVPLAERSYDIDIGAGTLAGIGGFCLDRLPLQRVVLVADENVERPHAQTAALSLARSGAAVDVLLVDSGESSKCVEMADGLWQALLALGADRRTPIVALGGGVVGDLAGFVAATFARGLPFFQAPTTLLAQVDSSVGGKVGINLPAGKNMVGAFWQPRGVLIDTRTLATLPEREYRSGLAEVVKYGVILDAEFFAWLEAHVPQILARDEAALVRLIGRCCELKAEVVRQDEREETGLRAVLNFGHTFCHAFESLTGYGTFLHGEAVSIGMQCAARLACRLGRVDEAFVVRQRELLRACGLPIDPPALDADEVLAAMGRDKKSEGGRLRLVLPTRLGHVELVRDVPVADVRAALT